MSESGAGDGAAAGAAPAGSAAAAQGAAALPSWASEHGFDADAVKGIEAKGWSKDGKLNVAAMGKAYFEVEKRAGSMLPTPDPAKLKEWSGWDKLGAAKDPSGYKFDVPLGEGVAFDTKLAERIAKRAHAERLPVSQAQALAQEFAQHVADDVQARADAMKQRQTLMEAKLKTVFGADKDARTARAQMAARSLVKQLEGGGLDKAEIDATFTKLNDALGDAGIVMFMDRVAHFVGEGALINGDGAAPGAPASIEAAEAEIQKLRSDPAFMKQYNGRGEAGHAQAVEKMKQAYDAKAKLTRRAASAT